MAFVQSVIDEGIEPASEFPSGPYPKDKLLFQDARGAVAMCVGIDFGAISSVRSLPHHAARSMI
jgi:hypothetical protein